MAKYKHVPRPYSNGLVYAAQFYLYLIVLIACVLLFVTGEPEIAFMVLTGGTGAVLLIWGLFGRQT